MAWDRARLCVSVRSGTSNEKQMRRVVDEVGVVATIRLHPAEFCAEADAGRGARWIPARIVGEAAVKEIETADLLYPQIPADDGRQLRRAEQMGVEGRVPAVVQVDIEAVGDVVLAKAPRGIDRPDKGRRRADRRLDNLYLEHGVI